MHNNVNENQEPTLLDDYTELFASYQNGNPQIKPELALFVTYIAREAIEMHIQWLGNLDSHLKIAEYLETLKSHEDDVFLHLAVAAFLLNAHMNVRLKDAAKVKQVTEHAREIFKDLRDHCTSFDELNHQVDEINSYRLSYDPSEQTYIN